MNEELITIRKGANAPRIKAEWGELTWFANREQGNATTMTLGQCRLEPGCANPRHYHPNCTEILTVLEGRIAHTSDADGATTEMHPGDTATIPPNFWHQARNVGEGPAILLIAFDSADRQTIGE